MFFFFLLEKFLNRGIRKYTMRKPANRHYKCAKTLPTIIPDIPVKFSSKNIEYSIQKVNFRLNNSWKAGNSGKMWGKSRKMRKNHEKVKENNVKSTLNTANECNKLFLASITHIDTIPGSFKSIWDLKVDFLPRFEKFSPYFLTCQILECGINWSKKCLSAPKHFLEKI